MTIKILFVRPTLEQGGADRATLQLLKHFDRSRFEAHLALNRIEGEFVEDVPDDVPVHSLHAKSLWWTLRPLSKLIKEHQYDVVYSTSTGTNIPVAILKSYFRLPGTYVLSERNSITRKGASQMKQRLLTFFKRNLYRKTDWITAVSDGIRRQLCDYFKIDESKSVVVHNPLIDENLTIGMQEDLDHPYFQGEAPVILAAGRMVDAKNFPMLLRAFKLVLQKRDARLCILGSGPKMEEISSLVESLGLSDTVSLPGFDKNPYRYMAKCDVFVLSSNAEGMPGVLVQALACGAAAVATDCPTGPNEIIEDGVNGFLVPVGDEAKTAEKILALLESKELRDAFREKAPDAVRRYHSQEAIDSYFTFLEKS